MKNKHVLRRLSHSLIHTAIRRCSNAMTFLQSCPKFWAQQRSIFLCCIVSLMLGAAAAAQNALPSNPSPNGSHAEFASGQNFFGDWGGKRSALAEKGIFFDFFYITDMQANPSGGLQQTYAGWERIRGTVDINFDKMIQWQGVRF